ncbi:MAG: hypothetical protein GY765_12935 [bacterium]|nr:hypothetical protein [bacterium]
MQKNTIFIIIFLVGLVLVFASVSNQGTVNITNPSPGIPVVKTASPTPERIDGQGLKADINFGHIPLYFIANNGQVNGQAKYYAKASRYTLWLTESGFVFDGLHKVKAGKQEKQTPETDKGLRKRDGTLARNVSRLIFQGADKAPEMVALDEAELKVNYFKGKDASKWQCNVPTSKAVLYKNLYANIDLKVYGLEKEIEYDWIVKPAGNPKAIRFSYDNFISGAVQGAATRIDSQGNLLIQTAFGELMHKKPVSFQFTGESTSAGTPERTEVEVRFKRIAENTYGFEVGDYDRSRELIIDPVVLAYSTYLGGSESESSGGIAVDGSNVYVTGSTSSTDFPTLHNYQEDLIDSDIFITRLDTTQSETSSLLYSTYIGGNSTDLGSDIAVDGNANVYVTGSTLSSDFPLLNQFQVNQTGTDAFVLKLNTSLHGSAGLVYSTYLGGGGTDSGVGIEVDSAGIVYVAGNTTSTNFPILNQCRPFQGEGDGFVTKLDVTKSGTDCLLYSTYLGGTSEDSCRDLTLDNSGDVFVTGSTESYDFPFRDQYQTHQGEKDAFVTRLDTTLAGSHSILYSTCLGDEHNDIGEAIAVDGNGCAYVAGRTIWSFPVLNEYQAGPGAWGSAFVSKMDTTKSGTSSLLYSTCLRGNLWDEGTGIVVDADGCVYVTGHTRSSNFPLLDPYQASIGTGSDCFITKLDPTKSGAASLLYSTFLGGNGDENPTCLAMDGSGNLYIAGHTYSTDYPTLNPFQANKQGAAFINDAFVTKFSVTGKRYYYCHGSDYTGDNSADFALYRPSTGRWCIYGNTSVVWGTSTDIPVPGDYNGDTITDRAFFRPVLGRWDIMGMSSETWGTARDIPVPGDYDGDGETDIAIYRPSTGRWCIKGQPSIAWGAETDIPVPADYDGDGDTDIAIFRPSNGRWCIKGQASIAWGTATDIPVPADYDGDGDTDIAIFRPSTGRWCIKGQPSIAWGTATDIPVPADYDGDGKADIAIYRPSEAKWAVKGSSSVIFGASEDIPLVFHQEK